MELKIKVLDQKCLPERKHKGDAGFDLHARIPKVISVGQFSTVEIPSGICVEIPPGYVGDIRPRSSLSKISVVAEIGTIDAGYRGELKILLTNCSGKPYHVQPYERVAQLVIMPLAPIESMVIVSELSESERGMNGLGSTGKM